MRKGEGQLLCDVWKEKIGRIWGRWFTSPRQSYSLVTSPPKRPATAAWRRRRPWRSQSICHTGPTKLRKKKKNSFLSPLRPPFSWLSSTFTLFFSQFPTWLPLQHLAFSSSYNQTIFVPSPHHSASFLYSPLWLCPSDPLNRFTLSILKVSLLPMISQSLTHSFCSALHSLIWFTQPPPRLCFSRPHSFPLAESPLISIRLPSASEEMKIDSPSSNCSSLVKEKGEAVSRALSKAVHPSLFEVWRQCCSEISAALTETRGRRVRGEALKQ